MKRMKNKAHVADREEGILPGHLAGSARQERLFFASRNIGRAWRPSARGGAQ